MENLSLVSCLLLIFSFALLFSSTIQQGFEPSPAPRFPAGSSWVRSPFSPAPEYSSVPAPEYGGSPAMSEPPVPTEKDEERRVVGAPAPVSESEGVESSDGAAPVAEEAGSDTVRWCAVREEYEDCQRLVKMFDQSDNYRWTCVQKDTRQACLESIQAGEADAVNLEAGLAYTAFINYSMKAIANEVYCNRARSFEAVAVVSRRACKDKEAISLKDFKGKKSCHGSYSTAAGWNYPINYIKESFEAATMTDRDIATSFFSDVCAPSEFGDGMCSGCGNENGSCQASADSYSGDSGAFRCLVEELGDIAFVRGDTPLLYSLEGPLNQSWSTKSVRDFMYLCPTGGCREINGYPSSCSFGTVPANVIMASNSIPNNKRLLILQRLTNTTWMDALQAGNNGLNQLLSPSTQEVSTVKKLTRSYLGKSASVSESIQELNNSKAQAVQSSGISAPDSSSAPSSRALYSLVTKLLSLLIALMLTVITGN